MMKKIFLTKSGAIEVQFNWIFVIIVGSLILLFFVSLIKTTEKNSSSSLEVDLKEQLDNIISQSLVDVGTTRTIELPNIAISVDCNEIDIVSSSSSGKSIVYKTIFSPYRINERTEMLAYSLYYRMPYPVDYFLYLTSRQIRYNFVRNTNCVNCQKMLQKLIDHLPKNMTYNIVDDASIVEENNYYEERFIYFNETPLYSEEMGEMRNVIALNFVDAYKLHDDYTSGKFDYYVRKGNGLEFQDTYPYLGFPMAIGGVFSDSRTYQCNVEKAMLRLMMLSEIYSAKTSYFKSIYGTYVPGTTEYTCYQIYNNFNLQNTITILENGNTSDFSTVSTNAKRIDDANQQALYQSCPLIY